MKKLLIFTTLCLISTFTFAKTDFLSKAKTIEIIKPTPKFDFGKYKLNVNQEVVLDENNVTCTATYTINIIDSETGRTVGVITRSDTFTTMIAGATCEIAMARAQQMAEDALGAWLMES